MRCWRSWRHNCLLDEHKISHFRSSTSTWTPLSLQVRDEETLQSRRQTDQRATSKDAGAETPQCAEGCTTFQFVPYSRVDGGRLVCSRTERSSGAAEGHIVPHPQAAGGDHSRPTPGTN